MGNREVVTVPPHTNHRSRLNDGDLSVIFVSETTLIVASLCSVEPVLNHYWTTITEPSYQLDDVAAEGNSLLESFGCEMIGIGSVESIKIVDGDVFVGNPHGVAQRILCPESTLLGNGCPYFLIKHAERHPVVV